MTQRELVLGSATFLVVIVAGFFATMGVDRHYASTAQASGTACVGPDGSWKNWVWGNVPALSPKCE
jgi:hypothetical protein